MFNECKGKYEHFKVMIFGQFFDRFTIGIPLNFRDLARIGQNLSDLYQYENVRSANIFSRMSERFPPGNHQNCSFLGQKKSGFCFFRGFLIYFGSFQNSRIKSKITEKMI